MVLLIWVCWLISLPLWHIWQKQQDWVPSRPLHPPTLLQLRGPFLAPYWFVWHHKILPGVYSACVDSSFSLCFVKNFVFDVDITWKLLVLQNLSQDLLLPPRTSSLAPWGGPHGKLFDDSGQTLDLPYISEHLEKKLLSWKWDKLTQQTLHGTTPKTHPGCSEAGEESETCSGSRFLAGRDSPHNYRWDGRIRNPRKLRDKWSLCHTHANLIQNKSSWSFSACLFDAMDGWKKKSVKDRWNCNIKQPKQLLPERPLLIPSDNDESLPHTNQVFYIWRGWRPISSSGNLSAGCSKQASGSVIPVNQRNRLPGLRLPPHITALPSQPCVCVFVCVINIFL